VLLYHSFSEKATLDLKMQILYQITANEMTLHSIGKEVATKGFLRLPTNFIVQNAENKLC
jgi:hypothetical protein